jgi:electron transfer flavoprotein alpha/beta subunit
MKAVVTARPAPHRVDAAEDGIDPYRWNLGLLDRVALEAAFQTAEEVVAVGIGSDRARDALRSALRRGADDAVLVEYDPIDEAIGEKYAKVLARAAGRERPDALFLGESSPVAGVEIGGMAADHLGWPTVSRSTAIGADEVEAAVDVGADELAIQRKLATGRQEVVAVEPPTVVGVDGGFANPRRAPLDIVISGGQTEIRTVDLGTIAPSESRFSMSVGNAQIESITANEQWGRGRPPRSGGVEERIRRMLGRDAGGDEAGTVLEDLPPEEAADRVVAYLRANELL